MICARCDKPIKPGEAKAVDKFSTSGPGMVLHVHRELCAQPPTQTAPESSVEAIRGR